MFLETYTCNNVKYDFFVEFKKDTLKHKQMKKPNQKFYLTVLMTL